MRKTWKTAAGSRVVIDDGILHIHASTGAHKYFVLEKLSCVTVTLTHLKTGLTLVRLHEGGGATNCGRYKSALKAGSLAGEIMRHVRHWGE